MATDGSNSSESEERVDQVVVEYLSAIETGRAPDRQELLAQHPDLAGELAAFFADRDHLENWARPMRALARAGLLPHRVCCPHCHNSIEVAAGVPAEILCPSCGSSIRVEPVERSPLAGRSTFGRFELLGTVGVGAFGTVYKARDPDLDREVAIKVPNAGHLAAREELDRFLREGRSLAQLHHPGIVPVYEVGQVDGLPYLVEGFMPGRTLAEVLPVGPRPPAEAARLLAQVADALQYAHEQGVVHRDLKPSNILLSADGTPLLVDFGLARWEGFDTSMTLDGQLLGTPAYMSPEQAVGSAHLADPRSDVYSLGVVLYQLSTGELPFRGNARMLLNQVLHDEPRAPRSLNDRLPRNLETICLKCLRKEPQQRYASAGALAEDLRRFLAGQPIHARPAGVWERTWRWCRRNPAVAALATSVLLLLAASAVGATFAALRLSGERDSVLSNLARAQRAEQDANEKLFKSTFAQAQALRHSGQMGQRFESLKTLEEAVRIAQSLGVLDEHAVPMRTEAMACLALADLRVLQEWEIPPGWNPVEDCPVAFDAGLVRYAWSDSQGTVRVVRVADHREIARFPRPTSVKVDQVHIRFIPGGRFLTLAYWLQDRTARFVLRQLPGKEAGINDYEFETEHAAFSAVSGEGRWLAVAEGDGSVSLHDLETRQRKRLGPGLEALCMALRPDGRRLAFTSVPRNYEVQVLDVETNQVIGRLSHADDVRTIAWSADGRLLAAGCDDQNVHVWDAEEWKQQAILEGHQGWVTALAFSPVGELLASYALDDTTRLWDPVSGRQLVSAPGRYLEFGSDGRRLAFQRGQRLGFWEVADGRECHVLHHGRIGNRAPWLAYKGPEGLDFSGDGRLLVSAAGDGVRLFDVAKRREVAYLNAGHHEAALFHPDGSRLYTFGRTGLWCWPIRDDDRGPGSLRVGPPQLLATPAVQGWFRGSRSADGNRILAGDHLDDRRDRLLIFPADRTAERTVLGEGFKFARIALSPDGRWAAAGQHDPDLRIKVWDARTGRLECSLACEQVYVTFSPDSQWLLGGGMLNYRLWKTGSWEPGPLISRDRRVLTGGPAAFRPDGRVLAIARSLQHVQLLDFAGRREIATLAGPDRPRMPRIDTWFSFSPDGGLLAVPTSSHSIHLWDLDAISRRLREMALDCDLLPGSPPKAAGGAALRIRVFQEVLEAEHLKIVASADCTHVVQDMKPWGREHWSNGKQLLCQAQKGGYVELQVDVPETGWYALEVSFTKGPTAGLVEVALDGKKMSTVFDGLNANIVANKVEFGTVELREGSHRLRFTAANKNPRGTGYFIGIDCLKLAPVRQARASRPSFGWNARDLRGPGVSSARASRPDCR